MDIFKRPLVEYIPIQVKNSRERYWKSTLYNEPEIFVYISPEDLMANLPLLGLPETDISFKGELAIITLNFKVTKIYYRFHTVKLIGEEKDDYYHLFSITDKYFPQRLRVLHFILFSETGEKLAWKNSRIRS